MRPKSSLATLAQHVTTCTWLLGDANDGTNAVQSQVIRNDAAVLEASEHHTTVRTRVQCGAHAPRRRRSRRAWQVRWRRR